MSISKRTVKYFVSEKGYGFIRQTDGPDVFFHVSELLVAGIEEGDAVEFEVMPDKKRPERFQATDVRVIERQ